jgi:transposase
VVSAHFGPHPDAEIYASQPGLGTILAARVLGEFGDDPHRYLDAKARSLRGSPGAWAYYQPLRDRNIGHQAALRQVANRLVGILHGCLKTQTRYDEHTAWSHHMAAAA